MARGAKELARSAILPRSKALQDPSRRRAETRFQNGWCDSQPGINPGTTGNLGEGTMKQANSRPLNRLRSDYSSRKNTEPIDPSRINEASFSYYRRLERVWHFVEENYPERISLADAAQIAGMERTAFSDFFRRKTGICFRDWLALVRVIKAKELMSENNHRMREIAHKVGYRDLRSFERVFRRVAGCSPNQYKSSVRPS